MRDAMCKSCKMFGRNPGMKRKNTSKKKMTELFGVSALFIHFENFLSSLFAPFGRIIEKPTEVRFV